MKNSQNQMWVVDDLTNAERLENARLFDETQRLLKITEERAQELAVINSVQAALAARVEHSRHL
ncbi:hypothetical protein [Candidatus Villigracilis saccharophilus]|uniref:hypothetical protein n=1 Tax=Candidatus Villigracilis saccharophilus TaxID=3140684 RepID=UPI003135D35E|nr:hypothetical protein [Anaerolineales bacterium]